LQYASESLKQDVELIKIANQKREVAEAAAKASRLDDDLPF
jgi:hypothetical protein